MVNSFLNVRGGLQSLGVLACVVFTCGSTFASFVINAPTGYGSLGTNYSSSGNSAILVQTGNQTGMGGPNGINAAIASILGNALEIYKSDVIKDQNNNELPVGGDSGPAASFYTTTFNVPGPSDATIELVGSQFISNAGFLLVKNGNHAPAWYLFDIRATTNAAGWNGQHDLKVTGFWPAGGAISHVTIYGGSLQTAPSAVSVVSVVPEPCSSLLMLLGLASLSSGMFRFRQ